MHQPVSEPIPLPFKSVQHPVPDLDSHPPLNQPHVSRQPLHLEFLESLFPKWRPGGLIVEIRGDYLLSLSSIIELLTSDGRNYKCLGVIENVSWEDLERVPGWSSCIEASGQDVSKEQQGLCTPRVWRSDGKNTVTEDLRMRIAGDAASSLTTTLELVTTGRGNINFTEIPSPGFMTPLRYGTYDDRCDDWLAEALHAAPLTRVDGASNRAHSKSMRMREIATSKRTRQIYYRVMLELVSAI